MNKKVVVTGLAISTLAVNVMADTVIQGPVEPTAVAPIATGYNSMVGGINSKATGTNGIILGHDNVVTGDNTTVIGGGNNTIANGEATVIGYNNTIQGTDKEITVIGSNNTASGQGAFVVGTHASATAIDAVALGNNAVADNSNSVALGTNSVTDSAVGVDGITINGTKHIFAGEQPASVVSFGSRERAGAGGVTYYNRQLQNVSAGRVEADSLDAINGSQLFAVVDEVETNATNIANNKTAISKNKENIKDIAVGLNMLGDIVNDREQAIANNTKNIAGNTTAINNNANKINANTNAINGLGQKVATNTADIRVLEHVADNHEQRITTLENRSVNLAKDINNKVNNLGQRVNKLGASSAALAGLHPLDFNRNDKASYAVSYGHYRNANAVALGAFYRPNERTMIGAGVSLGGETQLTLNVAFKTGKGSDYLAEAKDKDSRISKLEAMVQKLMAEVEQQKAVK